MHRTLLFLFFSLFLHIGSLQPSNKVHAHDHIFAAGNQDAVDSEEENENREFQEFIKQSMENNKKERREKLHRRRVWRWTLFSLGMLFILARSFYGLYKIRK